MKGLLTKDIRLIFGQKRFFLVMLLLTIYFVALLEMVEFGMGYLIMMVGLLTVTTIAYDEQNNGCAFLLTMPISRRGYAVEKYVLGIGLGAVSCLLVTVLAIMIGLVKNTEMNITEFIGASVGIYLSLVLVLALMLPIIFQFGAERGRVMFALIVAVGMVALIEIGKMVNHSSVLGVSAWLDGLELGPVLLIGMTVFVLAAILCISMFISIRIMEKKQF